MTADPEDAQLSPVSCGPRASRSAEWNVLLCGIYNTALRVVEQQIATRSGCPNPEVNIQTIDRAFAVLGALAGQPQSVTLAEVARSVELPKTTVLRLLSSLEELGMVERISGRYLLGKGISTLTRRVSPAGLLRAVARPHLMELSESFGENAAVAIADGSELLYIDTADAPGAVQVSDWTGKRVPFHTDAAGLILMTEWSQSELEAYTQEPLAAPTQHTMTSFEELRDRTSKIRTDGYAWTFGEFSEDVNGIAAPVVSEGTVIGAVNVYGPAYRWPDPREKSDVVSYVTEVCSRISARFAGDE